MSIRLSLGQSLIPHQGFIFILETGEHKRPTKKENEKKDVGQKICVSAIQKNGIIIWMFERVGDFYDNISRLSIFI